MLLGYETLVLPVPDLPPFLMLSTDITTPHIYGLLAGLFIPYYSLATSSCINVLDLLQVEFRVAAWAAASITCEDNPEDTSEEDCWNEDPHHNYACARAQVWLQLCAV